MEYKRCRFDTLSSDLESFGRTISLISNHFKLVIPRCNIFHYDINIKHGRQEEHKFVPLSTSIEKKLRKASNQLNREIVQKLIESNCSQGELFYDQVRSTVQKPVFDGVKNLYTCNPLNGLDFEKLKEFSSLIELNIDGRDCVFQVKIKFAAKVELTKVNDYLEGYSKEIPFDGIRALDIILRNGPSINRIPIGNCIYPIQQEAQFQSLGSGKNLIYGHFQSVRPAASGLNLIIDRSSTAFYESGDLLDFVRSILKSHIPRKYYGNDSLDSITFRSSSNQIKNNIDLLSKEMKGLQIEVNHLSYKRKFKIFKLTSIPLRYCYFELQRKGLTGLVESRGNVSVPDYFQSTYKRRLQYLDLPCLNVGSSRRPIYLPMEVCQVVPNQQVTKKLSLHETSNFVRSCAAQDSFQRFEVISNCASAIQRNSSPFLQEFSIDLSANPIQVDGVCLNRPLLLYKDTCFEPTKGKWNMNDKKVLNGISLSKFSWVVVNFTTLSAQNVRKFLDILYTFSEKKGIKIEMPLFWKEPRSFQYRSGIIEETIQEICTHYQNWQVRLDLIMFLITKKKDDRIYNDIKLAGDTVFGINTQCITDYNVRNCLAERGFFILSNLLLKLNAKLGGVNNTISKDETGILGDPKTMIMGADVTHPSEKVFCSVAACVASYDSNQSKYISNVKLQEKSRDEMIKNMDIIFEELIEAYLAKHNAFLLDSIKAALPERILFYRDGVSDGQFEQVMEHEIGKMKKVFEKITSKYFLTESYRPRITFIIVQKRHHTRLRPANETDGVEKNKNVPSGTLVTEKIVQKHNGKDFFLCSHEGSQGTSRPSHYYVLLDENGLSPQDIYQVTFSLCHIYVKCTKVISIPSPVQYAHLAAFRARQHLSNFKFSRDEGTRNQEMKTKIQINEDIKAGFYFI